MYVYQVSHFQGIYTLKDIERCFKRLLTYTLFILGLCDLIYTETENYCSHVYLENLTLLNSLSNTVSALIIKQKISIDAFFMYCKYLQYFKVIAINNKTLK